MMMPRKNIVRTILFAVLAAVPCVHANEFVKTKKESAKKETAAQVKQDIAELLEQASRQLGTNIQIAVDVQHQMFDQIKEIMGDCDLSTAQLKELRAKLQACLQKLVDQYHELSHILQTCK